MAFTFRINPPQNFYSDHFALLYCRPETFLSHAALCQSWIRITVSLIIFGMFLIRTTVHLPAGSIMSYYIEMKSRNHGSHHVPPIMLMRWEDERLLGNKHISRTRVPQKPGREAIVRVRYFLWPSFTAARGRFINTRGTLERYDVIFALNTKMKSEFKIVPWSQVDITKLCWVLKLRQALNTCSLSCSPFPLTTLTSVATGLPVSLSPRFTLQRWPAANQHSFVVFCWSIYRNLNGLPREPHSRPPRFHGRGRMADCLDKVVVHTVQLCFMVLQWKDTSECYFLKATPLPPVLAQRTSIAVLWWSRIRAWILPLPTQAVLSI